MAPPTAPLAGRRANAWDDLRQDVRYAVRALRANPGFALVAVLTLAVGIGINTTSFGLIGSLAFHSFSGVADQERLVAVHHAAPSGRDDHGPPVPRALGYDELLTYRARTTEVFDGMAASVPVAVSVGSDAPADGRPAESATAHAISSDFFHVLGARPALGRFPDAGDATGDPTSGATGDVAVVVLGDALWRERFGARPDVVGTTIRIGDHPFTVVGVAAPEFAGISIPDVLGDGLEPAPPLWLPLGALPLIRPGAGASLSTLPEAQALAVVARLRDGVTIEQASAVATRAAREVAASVDAQAAATAWAHLGPIGFGPDESRATTWAAIALAMMVPTIVLLIACANLANLQLARAWQRGREVAVRLALGASRRRIVRQLLTESLLLSIAGAGGALLLLLPAPRLAAAAGLRLPAGSLLDVRMLAFTAGTVVVTTLLFGLVPALRATRPALTAALRDGGYGASSGRSRLRGALVTVQVALSTLLLVMCGLVLLGARAGHDVPLGFERDRLALASIDFTALGYDAPRTLAFQSRLLERLRTLPDVQAAGIADAMPLQSLSEVSVTVPGRDGEHWAKHVTVTGDFLRAAGIPLLSGTARTTGEGVVVSASLARRLSPDGRVVGRRVRIGTGASATTAEITGVAGDLRVRVDGDPEAMVLVPSHAVSGTAAIWVRTRGDEGTALVAIRDVLRELDPRMPVPAVTSADTLVDRALRSSRMLGLALGGLGALALVLAIGGVYAVMSFLVARRGREIGIRMALGASRGRVLRLVLVDALRLTTAGTVAGLVAAVALAPLARALLNGMSPFVPAPFVAVATALLATALLAAALPARRATRVEPTTALRYE